MIRNGWGIGNDVILLGYQLLLKEKGDIKSAKQAWRAISNKNLAVKTTTDLRSGLHSLLAKKVEQLHGSAKTKEAEEWFSLWREVVSPKQMFSDVLSSSLEALKSLQRLEIHRHADQRFLEGIVRIADTFGTANTVKLFSPEPVLLGVLFSGMGGQGSDQNFV